MDPRRRDALKLGGYTAAAAIGAKSLHEAGSEVVDILNGKCDTTTDTITLGPGDAVRYRQDGQTYYLAHTTDGLTSEARFGPVDGENETIRIGYNDTEQLNGPQLSHESRTIPLYVHVNLGDILTGGDVVEPRGFLGISPDTVNVEYDEPVCVIERGETTELAPTDPSTQ
ncbi:MAG: hypothetical protein ABEI97_02390 [Candidatus Nanohaloarchaea archaeon]